MQRRLLAGLGAVAIIVTAVIARSLIDSDDDPAAPGPGGDGDVLVVCDPDFEAQCEALTGVEVRIEDSAVVSAAVVDGDLDEVDAWITSDAWFEVTAGRAAGQAGSAERIASTPVVVAVDPTRFDAMSTLCAGSTAWECLLDNAGQDWGSLGVGDPAWRELKVGLPDADTATGLSVLASVAAGHFGGLDFASNDFDAFRPRLRTLAEPSGRGDRQPLRTLLRQRGTYSAAGALAVGADRAQPPPGILTTEPAVAATVVLVDLPDGDAAPDAGRLRTVFGEAGWSRAEGEPPALLSRGVMGALHDLWREVIR